MKIFKSHQTIDVIAGYIQKENPLIIEIGAFHGHDTVKMIQKWPQATIFAFEPVRQLYEKLVEKTKEYQNIHVYQTAISNHDGVQEFYLSEKPEKPGILTQAGSLQKPKERLKYSPIIFPKTTLVNTQKLDTFVQHQMINHIDLLWIDTQGHEYTILQTAPEILKIVDFIFMEVGFVQAYEGQIVYPEIIEWMEKQNFYVVAQDFENTTDWFFGNVLLQRKNK